MDRPARCADWAGPVCGDGLNAVRPHHRRAGAPSGIPVFLAVPRFSGPTLRTGTGRALPGRAGEPAAAGVRRWARSSIGRRPYPGSPLSRTPEIRLETHGPLGTLWVGLGLCAFYIALVWINTLLGFVLTPLFIVPATWLMDKVKGKAPVRG